MSEKQKGNQGDFSMKGLEELQKDIAASLYMKPGTLAELMSRDFLKNTSEEGLDRLLDIMEKKNWVFSRGEVFHTRAEFALSKEMSEYELSGLRTKFTRPTIKQVVKRWKGGKF
jgi:hypothetical protein